MLIVIGAAVAAELYDDLDPRDPAGFQRGGPVQDQLLLSSAATSSSCRGLMAVVKTNVSVSSRCRGEWPMTTSAPSARRPTTVIDSRASKPLTGNPRSNRMRASALIPEPAMPMMCTRPRSASAGIRSVAALRTSAAPGAFQLISLA